MPDGRAAAGAGHLVGRSPHRPDPDRRRRRGLLLDADPCRRSRCTDRLQRRAHGPRRLRPASRSATAAVRSPSGPRCSSAWRQRPLSTSDTSAGNCTSCCARSGRARGARIEKRPRAGRRPRARARALGGAGPRVRPVRPRARAPAPRPCPGRPRPRAHARARVRARRGPGRRAGDILRRGPRRPRHPRAFPRRRRRRRGREMEQRERSAPYESGGGADRGDHPPARLRAGRAPRDARPGQGGTRAGGVLRRRARGGRPAASRSSGSTISWPGSRGTAGARP